MKKIITCLFLTGTLVGCTHYDYYQGGVRYTQDGIDCVYREGEDGTRFNNDVESFDSGKKIVYRETLCKDLYAKDAANKKIDERKVLAAPVRLEVSKPETATVVRRVYVKPVTTRRFIVAAI